MSDDRGFDAGRKAQGFESQEHLDAFFKRYDHQSACTKCSSVGGYFPLDDGMQPYLDRCEEGARLDAWYFDNFGLGKAVRS